MKNLVNVSEKDLKVNSRNLPEEKPPSDSLIFVEENSLKTKIRENIPGVDRDKSQFFLKWGIALSFSGYALNFLISNILNESNSLILMLANLFTKGIAFIALFPILFSSVAFLLGSVSSGFRKMYIISEDYIISTYTGERQKEYEWIKTNNIENITWKDNRMVFRKDKKKIGMKLNPTEIEKIQDKIYF